MTCEERRDAEDLCRLPRNDIQKQDRIDQGFKVAIAAKWRGRRSFTPTFTRSRAGRETRPNPGAECEGWSEWRTNVPPRPGHPGSGDCKVYVGRDG